MSRASLLPFALLAATAIGCTPETRWGHEAVYAPALRGYVVAQPVSRLAPELQLGESDATKRLVLLDPITGKKLRCREDLAATLEPYTREAATLLRDDERQFKTLPAILTMPPAYAGAAFAVDLGQPILAFPELLRRGMSAPNAADLYKDGKLALAGGRLSEAERFFERSLARSRPRFFGDGPDRPERAGYYLGAIYQREGRNLEAGRAYRRFIERADVEDARAYADAERRLAQVDPIGIKPCRSQAPLTITWPEPRK
jgi:tetratricopeptide (TPR) repeat protein